MRIALLIISAVFIGALATLTALDIAHYGLTLLDVVAVGVVAVMAIGILGALGRRPPAR
jgi:hypothetical protein